MGIKTEMRAGWKRLTQCEAGLAYLEFALVLPVLLLMVLGGTELTRYVQAGQKVDKLTHTVVDLIAQAPTISEPEMDQIMEAVQHIMSPHTFSDAGVIIVSCVGRNENGQLRVKWQYKGGGTLARDSAIGKKGASPNLPQGFTVGTRDNIIIAESFYAMEPILDAGYAEPIEFYSKALYLPRLGELDVLKP